MMKKIRVLFICAVYLCVMLTGCAGNRNQAFDKSVYDTVLKEVKTVLSLPEEVTVPEGMEGIYEFSTIYGEQAQDLLGYQYQDLNGDNILELLIGVSLNEADSNIRNQIYLAYTVVNGNPEQILFSSPRSSYSLLSDGTFAYFASAGAAYSIFGEFTLTPENTLDCTDYYFTHEIDGDFENIGVYHNSTGNFGVPSSNLTSMTVDDFRDLEEELLLRTLPLEDVTPLSSVQ